MKQMSMAAAGLALSLGSTASAGAAEITFICSNALKSVVEELVGPFEAASGHKLKITFGSTNPLQAQIDKGEPFDVAILGVDATEALLKSGKLAAGSRLDIARSGIGIAIAKGAAKPDISSADAFKRTLLAAKSIAYSEGGLTGGYLKSLFQKLGISDALQLKTKYARGAETVAAGEAEIGVTQISEILPVPGAELLGPLPGELQQYTVFPAAIAAASTKADAAKALLAFLVSPDAAKIIRAKGLEPLG